MQIPHSFGNSAMLQFQVRLHRLLDSSSLSVPHVCTPHGLEMRLTPSIQCEPELSGDEMETKHNSNSSSNRTSTAVNYGTTNAGACCQLAFTRLNKVTHPARPGKLTLEPGTRLVLRLRAAEVGAHEPAWLTIDLTVSHASESLAEPQLRSSSPNQRRLLRERRRLARSASSPRSVSDDHVQAGTKPPRWEDMLALVPQLLVRVAKARLAKYLVNRQHQFAATTSNHTLQGQDNSITVEHESQAANLQQRIYAAGLDSADVNDTLDDVNLVVRCTLVVN